MNSKNKNKNYKLNYPFSLTNVFLWPEFELIFDQQWKHVSFIEGFSIFAIETPFPQFMLQIHQFISSALRPDPVFLF